MGICQQADLVIGQILRFWSQSVPSAPEERRQLPKAALVLLHQGDQLVDREGILYCCVFRPDGGEEGFQLVLLFALQGEVLAWVHQGHGHQGIDRTSELVRQCCYWPGLIADVARGAVSARDVRPPKIHRSRERIGND